MTLLLQINGFEGSLQEFVDQARKDKTLYLAVQLADIIRQVKEHHATDPLPAHDYADTLAALSELIVRKSAHLLPLTPEEAVESETDTAAAMVEDFGRYQELTELLSQLESQDEKSFARRMALQLDPEDNMESYLAGVSLDDLTLALHRTLNRFRSEQATMNFSEEIPTEPFSLADKIDLLRKHLTRKKISFAGLFDQAHSRLEVIITFLAMLELIKQQEVEVIQERRFGPIYLRRAAWGLATKSNFS